MVNMKKKSTLSLLNKMTLRSLKNGWKQFLAVILIGAIAVTLFVGLLSNAASFENQVNKAYSDGNLADLWVTTSKYDQDDIDNIEGLLNEGDEVEGRLYLPCEIPGHTVYLVVTKDSPSISKPYGDIESLENVSDGEYFYLDKEMKQTASSSDIGTYALGQQVSFSFNLSSFGSLSSVSFLDDFVLEGKENIFTKESLTLTSTVTGFISYPENVTKSSYNSSIILMSDKTFKKAFQQVLDENFDKSCHYLIYNALKSSLGFSSMYSETLTNPNQYLITVKDTSKLTSLKNNIQEYFNSKDTNNLVLITEKKDMPFYVTLDNDVSQARQFTFVFPFIFFAVAILVILTTLSQMILKERSQIGTLKAIGLTKKEITWHYISLAMAMVFIGIVLGEIIGPLIIPNILGQKYTLLYSLPKREYNFPTLYALLTAFVFLGITALVTYLVIRKEIQLKPVESMRPKPPSVKLKAHDSKKNQKVLSLSLKMGFRNIILNKIKSLMVLIGVMGCTALLVCGFGINDTIDYGVDHDVTMYRNADITVTFASSRSKEDALIDISKINGIKTTELSITSKSSIYKENGPQTSSNIYIIQENSEFIHVDFKTDEVAISQKISRVTQATVGDEIVFQYNNKKYKATVGVVYDAFVYHGIMVHQNASFFKDIEASLKYPTVHVRLNDNADVDKVASQISNLSYVTTAATKKDWQKSIDSALSSVQVMTNAVKVFAILLAIVVLYNLSLMNFKERGRDIATLKVLGFSKFEIALSLLVESLLLTFVGVLFGFALGYPFLQLVLNTNIVELVEYLVHISPLSFLYSFLLTFIVALVVNLILVRKTKSIKMVESLKSVE